VNEIIVMKDSKHENIVNFLDSFLQEDQSELWVVMEFMEGGALTDVIDNNPSISEDQIATVCLEVSVFYSKSQADERRHARAWRICTSRILFTEISRATMSSWTRVATLKSVSRRFIEYI
jgi:Protein kinase domain